MVRRKVIIAVSIVSIVFLTTFIFNKTQPFYKNFYSGKLLFEKKRYPEAIQYFLSAIRIKPEDLTALKFLSQAYEKTGDRKRALRALEMIAENHPDDREINILLADSYYSLSDYYNAERLYRRAIEQGKSDDIKKRLAEVLIWQEKYEEGLLLLEKLYRANPEDLKTAELLADAYMWSGQFEKAAQSYAQLLEKSPDKKNIVLKLADCLRFAGKDEEAIKLYEKYLNN